MSINIANSLAIISLAVSLVIVIVIGDKTSTLYHPIPSPVLAEEPFQNNTVTESITVHEVGAKEDNKVAPPTINISIVKGSTPLGDKAYQPNPSHVKVGSKITWTNDDRTTHTATSGTITSNEYGKIFDSGFLNKGKSFTIVFDHSDDYEYFCLLHPTMIGKIIVSD
jgi:plastocyanin